MAHHHHATSPVSLFLAEFFSFSLILAAALLPIASANTDPSDVQALQVMYNSLNSPSMLTGWKVGGGDPCGESWKGITCEGSAIVSIELSGLGLNGTLGYLLSNLMSLRKLDLSDNKIHDAIPYQLPPNLTSLNLARNNLTGNLPYSISIMASLNYLNLSNNLLSQSIGDIFANLTNLANLVSLESKEGTKSDRIRFNFKITNGIIDLRENEAKQSEVSV
ncbi:protein STRUBBELIG-RECEPTOR FAMILY 8-like isoform X2 [Lotus japonicus]|uniref:protein STRUBBELIG-RECEPTOR FAMILY 8-like isoform X2 n=1 Tax=Lotus japonicus TaxID=34305 RepID=UPI002583619C|nr:protein STRUBBELIG-RECEPTOR FAMILY 8-like isoform X2 [Lotus japonicus]